MKPLHFLPPALALLAAAIWIGTQHHSLSAVEDQNSTLKQRIDIARHQGPESRGPQAGTGKATDKTAIKKVDWKDLATRARSMQRGESPADMKIMLEMQRALLAMSPEELAAELDTVAALDIPEEAKNGLIGMLIGVLAQKDPKLVLERFGDRLGDDRNGMSWQLSHAFQQWAGKDLAGASAWLDAQIAAGKLQSKSLDGRNEVRQKLESGLISALIASDPAAAGERISKMPEDQRAQLFQNGIFFNIKPGSEKAIADLIRTQVPEDERVSTLASSAAMLVHQGGFERVGNFLAAIDASPEEREAIVAQAFQGQLSQSRDSAKLATGIEEGRKWAATQSPEAVDRLTGQALGQHYDFKASSELALKYHEQSGNDDLLVAFIQNSQYRAGNHELLAPLLAKIRDEAKREELRKQLSPHEEFQAPDGEEEE